MDIKKLKLGKLPPSTKPGIKLADVITPAITPAPASNQSDPITDNPMYGNDRWGDCVMAARAHMTRRFEFFEQGKILDGTTGEVLNEYWHEQGWLGGWCNRPNNGLVIQTSLDAWRKSGWTFAGEQYDIYAHAAVNWHNLQELVNAIYYLRGAICGVALPISAQKQIGKVWDVDNSPEGVPGSWGLHAIYLPDDYDLNNNYLTCITWGAPQKLTPAFALKYFDEAHAIVDDRDSFLKNSPVDVTALDKILDQITGGTNVV